MGACNCFNGFQNIGMAECHEVFDAIKKAYIVPLVASDGTRNKISTSDFTDGSLAEAFIDGKINNTDSTIRFYPLPIMENIETMRAEAKIETMQSGKKIYCEDGIRSFKGWVLKPSTGFKKAFDSFRCQKFGIYFVTKTQQIIGDKDGTDLYPIVIDNDTLYNNLIIADESPKITKLEVTFDLADWIDDGNLASISRDELEFNPLTKEALIPITGALAVGTTTGATLTLSLPYGFNKTFAVTGLDDKTKYVLTNVTDSAEVSISTMVETATPGVYTLSFSAQTSADILSITGIDSGYILEATTDAVP